MTAKDGAGALDLLVLEGDGIGPEITAATLDVLRAADRAFGLGLSFRERRHRLGGAARERHHLSRRRAGAGQGRAWRAARAGLAQRISAGRRGRAAIRPANCASGSISTPISARRARVPAFRRAAACRSISSSCARTPRASTPTARCISAPANSCRRPISRSSCARSRARARPASRRRRSGSRGSAGARSPPCTRPMCCACRTGFFSNARARWPRAIRTSLCEERIIDAMAALLMRDAGQFDVDRHHQHVRRYSVRRGLRDCRQPRARRLAQCRRGAWVAQAQHGSAPDIAGKNVANPSSLIGSAAMLLAWLGERRGDDKLVRAARAIEAALDRVIADPQIAHARPGRPARHRCLCGEGGGGARRLSVGKSVKPRRVRHQHPLDQPLVPSQRGTRSSSPRVSMSRNGCSCVARRLRSACLGVCGQSEPQTMRSGLTSREPARQRIDARIGRILGDAIGGGNLHPDLAGLEQAQQRAQSARPRPRRNQAEMVDHRIDRQVAQDRRERLDRLRGYENLHMPAVARAYRRAAASMSRRMASSGAVPDVAILTRKPRMPVHADRRARPPPTCAGSTATPRAAGSARHRVQHAGIVGAVEARLHQHHAAKA